MFVQVGFSFKGDIAVAFEHPFDDVPYIKGNDQHFGLLFPVNTLMVKNGLVIDSLWIDECAKGGKGDTRKLAQVFKRINSHDRSPANIMPEKR